MEPAVFAGGMRFVARVDDGTVERRLQADFGVNVVGTLAELIPRGLTVLAYADAPRPGPDLT